MTNSSSKHDQPGHGRDDLVLGEDDANRPIATKVIASSSSPR